ncbi:MAG: hypothetical protein ACRD2J_13965 [Thermoanaerobaculia bacterium]
MAVERKPIALSAAAAIVGVFVIPAALDQRWFDTNPYLLPLAIVAVVVLLIWAAISSDWFQTKAERFKGRHKIMSLAAFILVGGAVGCVLGAAAWWAIKKSEQHLQSVAASGSVTTAPGTVTAAHALAAPKLLLSIEHVDLFVPTGRPDLTGLAVLAKIRNAGTPSIATDWRLQVYLPSGELVEAQRTATPNELTLSGSPAEFRLEELTEAKPLQKGAPPIQSRILFYAPRPRNKVLDDNTVLQLSVSDFSGKEFSASMRIGDKLRSTPSAP